MARYLFLTWDGSGNQTPELGVAQALRARGHDIAFAGYESQQARIVGQGFRFAMLERANAMFHIQAKGDMMAAMAAGVWAAPAHLDDVRDAAAREAPDLLVIDCLLFGALAAAERSHLPAVVLVHSAPGLQVPPGGPFERFVLLEPVNALRSAAGLPPVASIWESWARFPTLCASLSILDPLAASAPSAFTYAGPIQEQLPTSGWHVPWSGEDPRPMVLVSFSAARVWDQTSRIQRTLTGLAERPVNVLVTASTTDSTRLTIPANACLVPFIPHAEVFPQTAVTVTHAGHGTITAALSHGVPVVCLPNTASDQPALAAQVAALGAGIALDGDTVPPEAIGEAVMQILVDRSFASAARRLAAAIAAADAPATAVTWLEAHVAATKPPAGD
jgi:UDP:flavonoid glycosyltransferase YjiC (YdhE family)